MKFVLALLIIALVAMALLSRARRGPPGGGA